MEQWRPNAYDIASQLTGITYTQGSTTLGNLTYNYDAAGRRIGVAGSLASVNLPAAIASASYDADNRLTQWGSVSPTYDLNGNLTNDGSRTYTWDARDRLTAISGTATFGYDSFGRRQSKTIGGGTTTFLYDRVNPIQELSGGVPTANLLAGPGVDQVFTRATPAGISHFLMDGLGSTLALTDSTGVIQTRYTYEPYGNATTSGAANDNSYQYTGRENDGTGLYYYRARCYNPAWQRFISEDPVGLAGGINRYAYVNNDPLNNTDPSGNVALVDNLIGAGVAVTVDLVAQYAQARARNQRFQINWTRTGVAAGAGFVTSGASALLGEGVGSLGLSAVTSFALRSAGNAAIGAASNVASTAALNYLQCANDSLATAAAAGAGFGGAASILADAIPAITVAISQARYNALSPGEKNLVNGIADLSGYQIGGPSPAAVAAGQQVGNFVGGGSSFIGDDSSACSQNGK